MQLRHSVWELNHQNSMCGILRLDFVNPWIQVRLVNLVNSLKKHLSTNDLPNTLLDVGDLSMSNKDIFLSLSSQCGCRCGGRGEVWVESK